MRLAAYRNREALIPMLMMNLKSVRYQYEVSRIPELGGFDSNSYDKPAECEVTLRGLPHIGTSKL